MVIMTMDPMTRPVLTQMELGHRRRRASHRDSGVQTIHRAISASLEVNILLGISENILASAHFNATALADSLDSIIFDNTRRLCTKMRTSHKIHSLQLERDSKDK